jgi:hypothetical protein
MVQPFYAGGELGIGKRWLEKYMLDVLTCLGRRAFIPSLAGLRIRIAITNLSGSWRGSQEISATF